MIKLLQFCTILGKLRIDFSLILIGFFLQILSRFIGNSYWHDRGVKESFLSEVLGYSALDIFISQLL